MLLAALVVPGGVRAEGAEEAAAAEEEAAEEEAAAEEAAAEAFTLRIPEGAKRVAVPDGPEGEGVIAMVAGPDFVLRVLGPRAVGSSVALVEPVWRSPQFFQHLLASYTKTRPEFVRRAWMEGEAYHASIGGPWRVEVLGMLSEGVGWTLLLEVDPEVPVARSEALLAMFDPDGDVGSVDLLPEREPVGSDWFTGPGSDGRVRVEGILRGTRGYSWEIEGRTWRWIQGGTSWVAPDERWEIAPYRGAYMHAGGAALLARHEDGVRVVLWDTDGSPPDPRAQLAHAAGLLRMVQGVRALAEAESDDGRGKEPPGDGEFGPVVDSRAGARPTPLEKPATAKFGKHVGATTTVDGHALYVFVQPSKIGPLAFAVMVPPGQRAKPIVKRALAGWSVAPSTGEPAREPVRAAP